MGKLIERVVNGKIIKEDENIVREVPCFTCRNLITYPFCRAFGIESISMAIRGGDSDHSLPLSELRRYTGPKEKIDENGCPILYEPFIKR